MSKKQDTTLYLIQYREAKNGNYQSVKARKIQDSPLGLSFIAISDFVFDSNPLVINPNEEAKKLEFEKIKTLHLSIYSIQSISEMGDRENSLNFKNDKSQVFILNQENLKN